MNTFICYERCSTCRKAQKWLDGHGIEYTARPIREQKPTAQELSMWIPRSGKSAGKFFNTSGQLYRGMGLSARVKDMTDEEKLTLDNDTFENTGKSRFFERRTSRVLY